MMARGLTQALLHTGACALLAVLSACGGGGTSSSSHNGSSPVASSSSNSNASTAVTSSTPAAAPVSLPAPTAAAANAVPLVLDQGIDRTAINTPFVTVTVCVPGSSTCQTIDHVVVDTGSYGLRIAASALPAAVALPAVAAPDGAPLAECAGFISGYAWGGVHKADVQIGGQTALGVPVQVVDEATPAVAAVPPACSNTGPAMGVGAGAKGILGVGFQRQDCGSACDTSAAPAMYFSCPAAGGCVSSIAPLASQVANPVHAFPTDNNGVAISLPAVPAGGARGVTGLLVFGVGTAANNQLGSARVYTADANGFFATVYKGRTFKGFIDSGSNGIFLNDATIAACAGGFYCPGAALSLSASVTGANGASSSIPFSVETPSSLPADSAAAHLAGQMGSAGAFDWGLPFFFGRTVFVAFDGASTPFGTGPYWGF